MNWILNIIGLFAVLNFLELFNDKSNTHEFVNLVKELALPGELTQSRSYDFEFMQVEKPYESYIGANVRLRYGCVLEIITESKLENHATADVFI